MKCALWFSIEIIWMVLDFGSVHGNRTQSLLTPWRCLGSSDTVGHGVYLWGFWNTGWFVVSWGGWFGVFKLLKMRFRVLNTMQKKETSLEFRTFFGKWKTMGGFRRSGSNCPVLYMSNVSVWGRASDVCTIKLQPGGPATHAQVLPDEPVKRPVL